MPNTAFQNFQIEGNRLDPAYDDGKANELPVNLKASTTFHMGEVLAESLTTPGTWEPYTGNAQGVQPAAPVLTSPATGALPAGDYTVGYRFVTADGRNGMGSTTAVTTAAANDAVHAAAVTPLPTGATSVDWFMSAGPGDTELLWVANNNGSAIDFNNLPAAGAREFGIATEYTWKTTGEPRRILRYACITDASGNATLGSGDSDIPAIPSKDMDAYYSGTFNCAEVWNLTEATLAALGGRLISGDIDTGQFTF